MTCSAKIFLRSWLNGAAFPAAAGARGGQGQVPGVQPALLLPPLRETSPIRAREPTNVLRHAQKMKGVIFWADFSHNCASCTDTDPPGVRLALGKDIQFSVLSPSGAQQRHVLRFVFRPFGVDSEDETVSVAPSLPRFATAVAEVSLSPDKLSASVPLKRTGNQLHAEVGKRQGCDTGVRD